MKDKSKKIMDYDQAPSGYVTMYNYKEPFMEFEAPDWNDGKAYGYWGVLLFDGKTDTMQCHLCGDWLEDLQNHLIKEHSIKPNDYKQIVGLGKKAVLLNEKTRAKLIANGLKQAKNLTPGNNHSKRTKAKIAKSLKERGNTMEAKNEKGTCPAQLIDRLKKKHHELGRTPTREEVGCSKTIKQVYGSMKEACRVAGIPYRKEGQIIKGSNTKYSKVFCIKFLRDHYKEYGEFPRHKWYLENGKEGIYTAIRTKFDKKELFKEALRDGGEYTPYNGRVNYEPEELLEFLRNFEKINGRKPSISDSRRKLIPPYQRYYYYFGSWGKALELAFD